MDFRVLGPLQANDRSGAPLPLKRPKQRTLLVILLLHANHPVSAARLTDALWGERPPRSPGGNLRTHVWAVRRALGDEAGRLRSLPGGYQLDAAAEELDLLRFHQLAAEGRAHLAARRPRAAVVALRGALGLWRGAPLCDVSLDAGLQPLVGRLEEERLALLEAAIESGLALGQHADLVGELRQAIADHPLRERLWGQLMVALYRGGRQADALDAFQSLRRRLADELGVEPGPELQRLQREILSADPRLAPPADGPPAAHQLPPGPVVLVGRDRELARVEELLAPREGRDAAAILAIDGIGGVGKSALALGAAHRLAERFPDGQLYLDLRGATEGLAPLSPTDALGWFLRALGMPGSSIPHDLDEAAAAFRSLTADRHLLFLLDNAASAAQVQLLLPGGAGCATLVTSRRVLGRLDGATHLHLGCLAPDDSVTLLAALVGETRAAAEPEATAHLACHCTHLPLALRIAGARLATRPAWPVGALARRLADERRRLDELRIEDLAVRSTFEIGHQALRSSDDPTDREAARALGLLGVPAGPDIGVAAAARLLARTTRQAEAALDRLVDARLLDSPRPGRYRFHDLLRLFARELAEHDHAPAARAEALRRLLHGYLADVESADRLLQPGHAPGAEPAGAAFTDREAALAWLEAERANLVAAATHAEAGGVPASTVAHLASLLRVFFELRGYASDWEAVASAALRAAGQQGDAWAEGSARHDLGVLAFRRFRLDQASDLLERGLVLARQAGDQALESSALNNLGNVRVRQDRLGEATCYYQRALSLRRELGLLAGQSATLTNLGTLHRMRGRFDDAIACHRQAVAINRRIGHWQGEGQALNNLASVLLEAGQADQAAAYGQQSYDLLSRTGARWEVAIPLALLGRACCRRGRPREGVGHLRRALATHREVGDRYREGHVLCWLGEELRHLGRRGLAAVALRRSLAIFTELGASTEANDVARHLDSLAAPPRAGPGRPGG